MRQPSLPPDFDPGLSTGFAGRRGAPGPGPRYDLRKRSGKLPETAGHIYAYTTPAYRRTRWKGARRGRGLIKVGFTTRDPHVRIREQIGASSPEPDPYRLLVSAPARGRRGSPFTDKDVHRVLRSMGCHNVHNEWFEATPGDVRKALGQLHARPRALKKATRPRRRESLRRWDKAAMRRRRRYRAPRRWLPTPLVMLLGVVILGLAGGYPEETARILGDLSGLLLN